MKKHRSRATRAGLNLRALAWRNLLPFLLLVVIYRSFGYYFLYSVGPMLPLTPPCKPHPTTCTGLCATVGAFVKQQREGVLSNPESWLWYYQGVLDYYKCTNATKVVEVGIAWGAQTAHHLHHAHDFFEEYHVVDPFLAGYDDTDPMSNLFLQAAPNATPAQISSAWYTSIAKDLGVDGHYLGTTPKNMNQPGGCTLRMHHQPSTEAAQLFGDHSLDAVFIDGLHTYEGVVEDIVAWKPKVRRGGSLIFNDYNFVKLFPGVKRAVDEEAARQWITVLFVDDSNAVIGGKAECATYHRPKKRRRRRWWKLW